MKPSSMHWRRMPIPRKIEYMISICTPWPIHWGLDASCREDSSTRHPVSVSSCRGGSTCVLLPNLRTLMRAKSVGSQFTPPPANRQRRLLGWPQTANEERLVRGGCGGIAFTSGDFLDLLCRRVRNIYTPSCWVRHILLSFFIGNMMRRCDGSWIEKIDSARRAPPAQMKSWELIIDQKRNGNCVRE
jgi:hypothetical protein